MERIPRHVAIIMDGNGRWAQSRGRPRVFGHVRGSFRVKPIVVEAERLGIEALTLFAFSTENWERPSTEVGVLWRLLKKFLVREADELDRRNVRLQVIGESERLPSDVKLVLEPLVERLSQNTGLVLTFALSYGGRREIMRAASEFARACVAGECEPEDLTESGFSKLLWTSELEELAEVDLLIRTSGEQRISNFMLWQCAYAELIFTSKPWPEFGPSDLLAAVLEYARRDRRFGRVAQSESLAPVIPLGARA